MVAAHYDSGNALGRIVLQPNRSWTWRANLLLVITLMVISLTIAVTFTFMGLWLVLPFTVLEMMVLTGCLYYCVRRTHMMEVLTLSRSTLIFERGINRPTQRVSFDRFYSRFFVRPTHHPWQRKVIALKCRQEELEVGSFLTEEDKDKLVGQLRTIIAQLDERRGGVTD